MDPTLFLIKRESEGAAGRWMLVSMHSGDFDGAGTDDDILQQFEDEVNTFWTLIKSGRCELHARLATCP